MYALLAQKTLRADAAVSLGPAPQRIRSQVHRVHAGSGNRTHAYAGGMLRELALCSTSTGPAQLPLYLNGVLYLSAMTAMMQPPTLC